jgi:hypothetical protein
MQANAESEQGWPMAHWNSYMNKDGWSGRAENLKVLWKVEMLRGFLYISPVLAMHA